VRSVFALVDCQNFYCLCERVFAPALAQRPVVVLSNNDGCVIARSEAVKKAGIPMGAPYFKYRTALQQMRAVVRSSNYALYADMSRRVMDEIEALALDVERYSIDEAFLTLPALPPPRLRTVAREIRDRIWSRQGLPVRVGVGPTKTLAKVANETAKTTGGVFVCPDDPAREAFLETVPVGDVWGIGSASRGRLEANGVRTAAAFRQLPDAWVQSRLTVTGLRTAQELRGVSCLELERARSERKSLVRSRSFGTRISSLRLLEEALSTRAQRAAEKLRAEGLVARGLQVFITTKRFGPPPHYSKGTGGMLPHHTAHAPTLVRTARRLLRRVYVADVDGKPVRYKKAGVMLYDLRPAHAVQHSLFGAPDPSDAALMEAVDTLNEKMGPGTVGLAAAGTRDARLWTMQRRHQSPHYTTRWKDLPVAR